MSLTLVGVLGDPHAEDSRVERALRFFRKEHVDAVLCVGDAIDGYGDDGRCTEMLRETIAVRGNHERWYLEASASRFNPAGPRGLSWRTWRWCAALPSQRVLSTSRGDALLCHGIGDDDMSLLLATQSDSQWARIPALARVRAEHSLMICGHTHERMVRTHRGLTVINAGTLDRRSNPGFAMIDFSAQEVRYFDIGESGAPTRAEAHRYGR